MSLRSLPAMSTHHPVIPGNFDGTMLLEITSTSSRNPNYAVDTCSGRTSSSLGTRMGMPSRALICRHADSTASSTSNWEPVMTTSSSGPLSDPSIPDVTHTYLGKSESDWAVLCPSILIICFQGRLLTYFSAIIPKTQPLASVAPPQNLSGRYLAATHLQVTTILDSLPSEGFLAERGGQSPI